MKSKTLTCDDFLSVFFEYITVDSLQDGILPSDKSDYYLYTDLQTGLKGVIEKQDIPAFTKVILEGVGNLELYIHNYEYILSGLSLDEALALVKKTHASYGIVTNQKGKIIGVLDWSDIANKLLNKYNYLDAQIHAVLDCVNDAITVINEHDVVEFWNVAAQKLYSIEQNEIIGEKIDRFFSNLVVTKVVKEKNEVREAYHQPRAGVHVLINSMPIKINGNIAGSVAAERDVTEVVQLHNQLSKASSHVLQLEQEISKIANEKDAFTKIYGHNAKLKEITSVAKRVAATQAAVLIRGESGTGKELFAEAIHQESARRDKPFIVINAAAIPATLLESELFGYEGGSFTGADKKGKKGTFELAEGGTIFLDEIGEMPLEMQAKLLRFLQNKSFYRIGGKVPVNVDVRILAATHRDLDKMITDGQFRQDLFYRLNVVSFDIPPLRIRKDDIPELAYIFVREFSTTHGKNIKAIEPELMGLFLSYHWPGNVRELRNVIERLVILSDNNKLRTDNLPEHLKIPSLTPVVSNIGSVNLNEVTEQTERQVIMKILEEVNWNKSEAAKKLGVPRSTLYYKLKALRIL